MDQWIKPYHYRSILDTAILKDGLDLDLWIVEHLCEHGGRQLTRLLTWFFPAFTYVQ